MESLNGLMGLIPDHTFKIILNTSSKNMKQWWISNQPKNMSTKLRTDLHSILNVGAILSS